MPQQNVEKMAKEADEMHRKFYPEQYGDPPLPPDPDPAPTPEPPPAEPVVPPVTVTPEPVTPPPVESATPAPPEGTPPATEPPDQGVAPAETPPATPAPEPWEGRYRTLQGKYDAEVPRLFAEIASLKLQLAQPTRTQAQVPSTPPPSVGPLSIKEILAGDKDLEEQLAAFNEDYPDVGGLLVKLTERAATVTTQKMNETAATVNAQVQSVQEFQAETRSQQYWDVVNRELPDWQATRDDPDFSVWLNQVDPYTGVSRAALTQDAIQKMDAHRVVNIYKGFRSSKGVVPQPNTPSPTPTTPPVNPAAALVAPPSGSRSAPASTPTNNEPTITSAYIKQFYNDAAKGKFRDKEKEFNAIETRINKAVSEGRVA